MKKLNLSLTIILAVLLSSCGNTADKKETKEAKENTEVKEKIVLDNKEDMMAKLSEFKITVPEGMEFRSVDMKVNLNKDFEEDTSHVIYFDMQDVDEAKKVELENWYTKQQETLMNNNWTKEDFVENEEMMGGGVYSNVSFKNESIHSTLKMGISFNDDNASTIHFHPKFD